MNAVARELRLTIRSLFRTPGFTSAAVLTLALGIGASIAIVTVINSVLLDPLPFKAPDRLVVVMETDSRTSRMLGVSAGTFLDWKDTSAAFAQTAAWRFEYFNLTGLDEPEQVLGLRVSSSFLSLLGAQPGLGRDFLPREERAGEGRVAIVTDALWRRRFGGDPKLIGETVTIERETYTIVGILPPTFQFFRILNRPVDLFVPLTIDAAKASRATHDLSVYARLKPDQTVARAQDDLVRFYAGLAGRYPDTNTNVGVTVRLLPEVFTRNSRSTLWLLLGAALMVLLIASANLINLMLARATLRDHEMAVRAALGADRRHLVRHVLCESVVLALFAGLVGLFLAMWSVQLLNNLVPGTLISRIRDFEIDVRTVMFALVLSVASGVGVALLPAAISTRVALNRTLRDAGRGASIGTRARRVSRFVVVAEVAVAMVLLSGALLMMQSAHRLVGMSRGLNSDRVLTMQVWLPRGKYTAPAQVTAFYEDVLARTSRIPGVQSASAINFLPLSRLNGGVMPFSIEGRAPARPDERHDARYAVVDSQYFRTMQIPLLAGREFRVGEGDESRGVAIIDKAMADRLWPNGNPIGERIRTKLPAQRDFWVPQSNNEPLTIVGVVGSIKEDGAALMGRDAPVIYVPYRQNPSAMMHLVVRTAADPLRFVQTVRRQVWAVDRDQPVSEVQPMNAVIEETFGPMEAMARLTGIFALLAGALAGTGVFALVGYIVGQRTREIGVRLALGARRGEVFRTILRDGAVMGGFGTAAGIVATLSVNRVLANRLFGVAPGDPLTLMTATALLFVICIGACCGPARRATKIEPIVALGGH
jgi:putative ABC transport system permease protein